MNDDSHRSLHPDGRRESAVSSGPGRLLIAGDLFFQMVVQGKRRGCLDGTEVAMAGIMGALSGGLGGPAAKGAGEAGFSRILNFSERNLQKGFTKHGGDFGLTGHWNPGRAADFSRAINRHINDPAVTAISDTYRGARATHYFNPATGVNVVADPIGNYVSGWRWGVEQMANLLRTGALQ